MSESTTQFRLAHCTAAVLAACASLSAQAIDFETDGGWHGSVSTTLSAGSSWRAEAPNPLLYSPGSGNYAGVGTGGKGATFTDSGDLNWAKGDAFSTPLKAVVDFSMSSGDMGVFARAKAWYDEALSQNGVLVGNADSRWARGQPLSDASQPLLGKFNGLALLDAYVYNTFDINGKPLQLRAGSQVVNWGESLFIQGVNQLNPIDVVALHKPGTEIKEALLPVWSLSSSLGLSDGVSLDAFYQLKWAPHNIDSCGGYWSPVEFGITTSVNGSGCNQIGTTIPSPLLTANNLGQVAAGKWVPWSQGKDGKDSGQYGLALRSQVDAIDSEVGVYAMQINSRAPIISGRLGSVLSPVTPPIPLVIGLHIPGITQTASGFWEYPDTINIFGTSLSTNIAGWSVGTELSYTPNQPVQINGNDLLAGFLYGVGPMGATAKATLASQGVGAVVSGYDRMSKTQFQTNTIKVLPGMLGAAQGTFIGEVGMQWLDMPNNGRRYGRAFIFGNGSDPTYGALGPAAPGGNTCLAVNIQPDGCKNDGYVTPFSWGYRLRFSLDYPNAFDTGYTLTPSLFFSQDVKGYSADGQFLKDRQIVTIGLKADYQKKFSIEAGYTTFSNRAKYDPFSDRDFYSASLSYTF